MTAFDNLDAEADERDEPRRRRTRKQANEGKVLAQLIWVVFLLFCLGFGACLFLVGANPSWLLCGLGIAIAIDRIAS